MISHEGQQSLPVSCHTMVTVIQEDFIYPIFMKYLACDSVPDQGTFLSSHSLILQELARLTES
jgi:hypothetical protein